MTATVPAAVPSDFHNSPPAAKNNVSSIATNHEGVEESGPGRTSFTMTVPASVPSVFQSSVPVAAS